eukprot:SAG22_NODE_3512_length_1670_cov_1.161680_2_plen_171_part_00
MTIGSRTGGSRTTASWGPRSGTRSRMHGTDSSSASGAGRWTGMDVTPWRQSENGKIARETMVSTQSMQKGGVVMTLWDRLRTTTTRTELLAALQQHPTVGPLDGGFCSWPEFEGTMLQLTLRLSIIESKWLKKEFSGHQDGAPLSHLSVPDGLLPGPPISAPPVSCLSKF